LGEGVLVTIAIGTLSPSNNPEIETLATDYQSSEKYFQKFLYLFVSLFIMGIESKKK